MKRAAKFLFLFSLLAAGSAFAADTAGLDVLASHHVFARLMAQTAIAKTAPDAKVPGFVFDPTWPQRLPHNWIMGAGVGVYVDHHDHIWVYQRPRSLTTMEAGLEPAIPGAVDAKGQSVTGEGFARPNGPTSDCCLAAPSVLEFDTAGKLLRSWGGPADPGFIGGKCKAEDGCIWPNGEHGIYIDDKDNVWLAGNNADVTPGDAPWITNKSGGDGFVLKFDMNGNFKMRIGGTPRGPVSNDTSGGINGTPLLYQPADMVIDPATNRLYVADGYGNRRILIVDATTGKYLGHFTAYGNSPVNDKAITDSGLWLPDAARGNTRPAFFRNAVHCVTMSSDGKIYVCDRGNDRVQVFDAHDPNLGKPCSNPQGVPGKCGFVGEQWISGHSEARPRLPGTAVSIAFSKDKAQSCMYVADNTNQIVYVLNRANLHELGRLGKLSETPGDFRWMHQLSTDSKGNLYTVEADPGSRAQKYLHYGAAGCSGEGLATVGGPLPE